MKPQLILYRWNPAYLYGFLAAFVAVTIGACGIALFPGNQADINTTFWTLSFFLTILSAVALLGCAIPVWDCFRDGLRVEFGERITVRYPFGSRHWSWDQLEGVQSHRSYYQDTIQRPTGVVPLPGIATVWFYEERTITKSATAIAISFKDGGLIALTPTPQQELAFNRWMSQKAAADIVSGLGGAVTWSPTREKFGKGPRWMGTSVQEVSLANTRIDDAQFAELLRYLAQCDELKKLDLSKTQLTDAALAGFHLLKRVPQVSKEGSQITDAALAGAAERLRDNPDNNRFAFIGRT